MADTKRKMTDRDYAELVASFAANEEGKKKQTVTLQNIIKGKPEKGSEFPRGDMSDSDWEQFLAKAKEKNMIWHEPDRDAFGRTKAEAAAETAKTERGTVKVTAGEPTQMVTVHREDKDPKIAPAPRGERNMDEFHGQLDETVQPTTNGRPRPGSIQGQMGQFLKQAVPPLEERRGGDVGASAPMDLGPATKALNAPRDTSGHNGGPMYGNPDDPGVQQAGANTAAVKKALTPNPAYAQPGLPTVGSMISDQMPSGPNAYDAAAGAFGNLTKNARAGLDAAGDALGVTSNATDSTPASYAASMRGTTPPPPGGEPPPPPPGGVSASMSGAQSFRGGMAAVPAPEAPASIDPEMKAQVDLMNQAIDHSAEIEQRKQQALSRSAEDQANQQSMNQAYAQSQQEEAQAGQKQMMSDYMDTLKILNDPAQTPDPERYWESHSRVMFAIGVGLLAAGGKDINGVLANVNHAIDRDVEQQKAKFEAPRAAARAKQANALAVYGMYRNKGHDVFESQKLSEATLKERTLTEIDKITASSKAEMVLANAEQLKATLMMDITKAKDEAARHKYTNDIAMFSARSLDADRRADNARQSFAINAKTSADKHVKMSADSQKRYNGAVEGLNLVGQLRTLRGKPEGYLGGSVESLLQMFPGTPADARRSAVDILNFNVATAMSKSSVQAREQEYWLGKNGKPGKLGSTGLRNLTQRDLDTLEGLFKNAKESASTGQQAAQSPSAQPGSSQDEQALAWANANPKDPRAAQIKQKLGR